MKTLIRALSLGMCLVAAAPAAWSQASNYPNRPIKLVVPFAPGGGVDLIARVVGQKLGERMGQSIVVENKPGASAMLGTDQVAKSAPDGYTLLLNGGSMAFLPALVAKVIAAQKAGAKLGAEVGEVKDLFALLQQAAQFLLVPAQHHLPRFSYRKLALSQQAPLLAPLKHDAQKTDIGQRYADELPDQHRRLVERDPRLVGTLRLARERLVVRRHLQHEGHHAGRLGADRADR